MNIRFLGQNGYIIETKNTKILIDPYLSDVIYRESGIPRLLPIPIKVEDVKCDAVICTHNHLDHLDTETAQKTDKNQFFITTREGADVLQKMGKTNVLAINVGESVSVGDIGITAVFADHMIEAFGLIIKAEGKTLYFSGDTLYNEKLSEISEYKPDITFICINGKFGNMNVEEAVRVAKQIGAKVNIPNHYDMFAFNSENPHLFADNIEGGMILEFNKSYIF